jgi:hypothetical protein
MGDNSQSHGMPRDKSYLMIVVMIGANLIYPPAKANTVYLPKTKFNEKVDRAHAECANIDLDFSSKFSNCLNMKLEATFIDSSTVE